MPQPDTLAVVDFAENAPFRRSWRDFLTGAAGPRPIGVDYWIRVHRRAVACWFEITLASQDALCVPAARVPLNERGRVGAPLSCAPGKAFDSARACTRANEAIKQKTRLTI
jgi:hypothetical protein